MKERNILDVIEDEINSIDFSRRGNFTKSVLLLIGLGSLHMTLNLVPALVQAFIPHTRPNLRRRDVVQALDSLERRQLITKDRQGRYVLTQSGEENLKKFKLEIYRPGSERSKKWDGKWRMIIFDIPEECAHKRKFLRSHLFRIGFVQRQKSVWVYPYPCHDLVELIRSNLNLQEEILYAVVDRLESDEELKKHFRL